MNRRTLIALLAAALIVPAALLWLTSRSVAPKEATWNEVEQEARKGGYRLIGTEALWEHYRTESERMLLVDTRQEWEFDAGHIRGARNFPMEPTWWARWKKRDDLERFLGPDKEVMIVFY